MCEAVRPEPNGKANILGFYGVLPFATILVPKLDITMAAIMFVVGLSGPADEFLLRANISDPDGLQLDTGGEQAVIKFPAISANQASLAGLGFMGLAFKKEGIYKIDLIVNNTKSFQSSFDLKQGALVN